MSVFFVAYLIACLFVAVVGLERGHSFAGSFLLSFVLSPLIGLLGVLIFGGKKHG